MRICPKFHVKNKTLLTIAGCVWVIAGVNVARLGLLSYRQIHPIGVVHILLSLMVFAVFGLMFYKMSRKHLRRISGYEEGSRPGWHFFDAKAYGIMVFMMGGGIWLRSSGLLPPVFIAEFYTGLGSALMFAGAVFWFMRCRYETTTM